ncbi:LCP family protein [Actinokineospora sp. UTMC 2448]|uniref:LCP family protein n=1 Tax=Actinokineospora sp. UTMC 2448 TaxID=2268449 RepID=UPI002164719D|nr:LCP family protein [Actinokineospora sp. UTMC 2448]UVS81776.1 Biofilm regulatory protein A precursor [Actinokineospora sp. UTMC 2448]
MTEKTGVRRGLLWTGRGVVTLVSAAVVAAMAVVWARIDTFQEKVTTTDALVVAQEGPDAPPADDGANDILLVGSDTRTDLQGRPLSAEVLRQLRTEATDTVNTDTLILLRLPKSGGKGYAVSIPRDTYVTVPGHRDEKINGAFGVVKALKAQAMVDAGEADRERIERESDSAGRTALIQAVQGLTGVRVDHYAEITLYGFYLLTEAIDGVDVCLNHGTSDPDSGASFRAGPQTVRGGDAVAFVRQRKGLPRGDLDRIVRQQTFLASAMNKVLSGGTLTDPRRLGALEDAVSRTVVMDPGLHFLDLVNQARALASGQVEFVTIPVTGVGARNDRGQSIITVDVPAVRAYVAALVSDAPPPKPAPPPVVGDGLMGGRLLTLNARARAAVPCVD